MDILKTHCSKGHELSHKNTFLDKRGKLRCLDCKIKFERRPFLQRFWENVEKKELEDCWIWNGTSDGHGYGCIVYNSKNILAHRASWLLAHGDLPQGMSILHKCDVPLCVNPNHLFIGTQLDNMKDMAMKKRSTIGEKNPMSKITQEIANETRKRYLNGELMVDIANDYDISRVLVSYIINNKIWKDDTLGNISRKHASRKGDSSYKLNWDQVNEIRNRYSKGELQVNIANSYGVAGALISKIVRNKCWKIPPSGVVSP